MIVLKRIGVLSFALTWAIVLALFGVIIGIISFIFGTSAFSAMGGMWMHTGNNMMTGSVLGAFMIVIMPILLFIEGFIIGAITGWLYNLVAKWTGGIKLEFAEIAKK